MKGPLTLIKQAMLQETDLSRSKKSVVEFMLDTRERLRPGLDLATAHAQEQRSKAKFGTIVKLGCRNSNLAIRF